MRIKKLEVILLILLALILISGAYLERDMQALSDSVVRLRVVANSDSEADQSVKLKVRDEVLALADGLCKKAEGREAARALLSAALPRIELLAENSLRSAGFDYGAEVYLEPEVYPTREYEGFSLPAGEYLSLRVELGEAAGKNWWCVVFPPLCTAASTGSIDAAAEAGGFTAGQVRLITEADEGYVVKFRALELLDWLKRLFS